MPRHVFRRCLVHLRELRNAPDRFNRLGNIVQSEPFECPAGHRVGKWQVVDERGRVWAVCTPSRIRFEAGFGEILAESFPRLLQGAKA